MRSAALDETPGFAAFTDAGGRIDSNSRSLKWSSLRQTENVPGS